MKLIMAVLVCMSFLTFSGLAQDKKKKGVPKDPAGYKRTVVDVNIEGIKDKVLHLSSKKSGKRPLLIYLHGAGGHKRDLSTQNSAFAAGYSKFNLVCDVVHPQSQGMWKPAAIDKLIAFMLKNYEIDPKRVYIAGFSMGGAGTWYHVFEGKYPVAAYMPMGSGASKTGKVHEKWDIEKCKDKHIWMIHGDKDKVVPYANAKESADLISKISKRFIFTTLEGVAHNPGNLYKNKETFDWLLKYSSN